MKFQIPVQCSCGYSFTAHGWADKTFPPAQCPQCGETTHIIDPLSVSVVSERLLYRSKAELDGDDYTLPIICGAIAIEAAITQLYLKWRKIEHELAGNSTTDADKESWERDYRRGTSPGGFKREADFVSNYLTGKSYDDFVTDFVQRSSIATLIKAGFPSTEEEMKAEHIHSRLFVKRNRIMHWGEVANTKADAEGALAAAFAAFGVIKAIDNARRIALDTELKKRLAQA